MRPRWSRFALDDLEAIRAYIARERPDAAVDVAHRVRDAAETVGAFPAVGRAGRVPGTREHAVARTPYVLVYTAASGSTEILRVLHGAQDWPPTPPGMADA